MHPQFLEILNHQYIKHCQQETFGGSYLDAVQKLLDYDPIIMFQLEPAFGALSSTTKSIVVASTAVIKPIRQRAGKSLRLDIQPQIYQSHNGEQYSSIKTKNKQTQHTDVIIIHFFSRNLFVFRAFHPILHMKNHYNRDPNLAMISQIIPSMQ